MLCISISKSYIRYFSVKDNNIIKLDAIKLENKLDYNYKTADKFFEDLSAVFSIMAKQGLDSHKDLAISLPAQWTDLSIYSIDSGLSSKDKLEFFNWKNKQKYGKRVDDFIFQYYPIKDHNPDQYLVVGYQQKLKNELIQSALGKSFKIKFIDIDIFAVLNSIKYMRLDDGLEEYAILISHENGKDHSTLVVGKDGSIINYLEINTSLDKNPIVKNAAPIDNDLYSDIISISRNKEANLVYLSGILVFNRVNSPIFKEILKLHKNKIIVPEIQQNDQLFASNQLTGENHKIDDYLDVFGLVVREADKK